MKTIIVKQLMVPLSEYATVSKGATLYEAVVALERSDASFDPKRPRQRAILVYDENDRIFGKINQLDIIRALEPEYNEIVKKESLTRLGLSPMYQRSLIKQYALWSKPMDDLCRKAAEMKVETFMKSPSAGEYIDEDASLEKAIHQLIMGEYQNLLVTSNEDIVGILRLSDVFMEVVKKIKECKV